MRPWFIILALIGCAFVSCNKDDSKQTTTPAPANPRDKMIGTYHGNAKHHTSDWIDSLKKSHTTDSIYTTTLELKAVGKDSFLLVFGDASKGVFKYQGDYFVGDPHHGGFYFTPLPNDSIEYYASLIGGPYNEGWSISFTGQKN